MKKIYFIYILASLLFGMISCSKDDDEETGGDEIEDLIGTWTATSGKYNLSLEITAADYYFTISEPGKGGSYDKGTYDISDAGRVTFVNTSNTVLAMGHLKGGKLSLTFVSAVAIMMLGTEAASNTVFVLSEGGGEEEESYGFLVVQNLSKSNDIVALYLYDTKGNLIDSDSDVLEPGYQFTYEIMTGNYTMKITDDKGKSFTSKSFKVVKDKSTVLEYNGSTLSITATGIEKSGLLKATNNNIESKYSPGRLLLKKYKKQPALTIE